MVIELKDGSLITPMGVFDVLDVVEEYLGTDLRQYLEDWFENDREELTEDERFDELREHYVSVLETAEYELGHRYRSLIRGLPPTPAQAHQESLARAG